MDSKAESPNVTTNSVLIYQSPPGGAISAGGVFGPSIAVPATPNLVLVTNPAATATGGVQFAAGASLKAVPQYVKPANPTGNATAAFLAMGLGAAVHVTPLSSGNVLVSFDMTGTNATATNGFAAEVIYGTGTAPANGAAIPGGATVLTPARGQLLIPATVVVPISFTAVVPALTVGTAYWFDLAVSSPTAAGIASVASVSAALVEL